MERYKFLFKPAFFIFSLLFACWMVLKIEQLSPSDFGRYESLFTGGKKEIKQHVPPKKVIPKQLILKKGKDALRRLFSDYHSGVIDSVKFNNELERLLKSIHEDVSR